MLPSWSLAALLKSLFGKAKARRQQQDTTQSRSNRVATISVSPRKLVGYQGQRISFSAIGKDGSGNRSGRAV